MFLCKCGTKFTKPEIIKHVQSCKTVLEIKNIKKRKLHFDQEKNCNFLK